MGLPRSNDGEARFSAYVEGLTSVIGHADRAKPLRDYCLGLMMPCERKSVEPMAAITAPERTAAQHQSLLHFIGEGRWSDEKVLAKVRELVLPELERHGPIEAWIIDEAEGEKAKNDARPHAACPRARTSTPSGPVWRPDEVGGTVPVACRDREKALPDAWRCAEFRWTERAAQRQLQARHSKHCRWCTGQYAATSGLFADLE